MGPAPQIRNAATSPQSPDSIVFEVVEPFDHLRTGEMGDAMSRYLGVDLANEVEKAAEIVVLSLQIVCGVALKSGT